MACNYTKEQFDDIDTRVHIPLEQFRACNQSVESVDIYYAANPPGNEPLVNIPPGNVVPILLGVVAGLAGLSYFVVKNTNWKALKGEKPTS